MQKNLTFDQRTQRIEAWLSDFIELLDAPFAIRQDAIKQGREINDIIEALNGCITSQINAEQFNSILDRIRKSLRASTGHTHLANHQSIYPCSSRIRNTKRHGRD
jgi:hypothetical protein